MKHTATVVAALAAILALSVPVARADTFYGTDGFTGDLVQIDSVTGASSIIGNMGIPNGVGMAVDASTGVAYARDFNNLYTVNLSTGSTTAVGASGSGITGLAFDATFSTLYSVDQTTGGFYKVNVSTGAATLVGNTGISVPLDLTMNSAGVLYAANLHGGIYTINQSTGAATLLFSQVDSRGLGAISFDSHDNLFGITVSGDELVSINLVNGTTANIGGPVVVQDVRGLDFRRTLSAVPEPSSAALSILLGVGMLTFRRKRIVR